MIPGDATAAAPPADRELAGDLTAAERRRIGVRLGAGLLGLGLLALGTLLLRLDPGQLQVGELFRALAALIVSAPIVVSGLRGMLGGEARRATDQLVAIAILAAAASGDFVTATLLPLCLEIGRLFEDRSTLGARAAIDGIRALAARQAVRWRDGSEERVDPARLEAGDLVLVRPGERIAVDGTVIEGRAAVDQSAITGESRFEDVGPGSAVFAGTVAIDGLLRVKARGAGADTVLGRVVALLAEVERTRVPALRLFERRAGAYLPLVLTLAATTLFFSRDLSRAIAVLVVATPTALVVAGPAAIIAAMTVAARWRILIKSADFLERASEVDTLVLDKTGTVTVGAPAVVDIRPEAGVGEAEVLAVAASCGFGSLHPVSRAVVAAAQARGLAPEPPGVLQERPGLGVVAEVGGVQAALGSRALLAELGVEMGAPVDHDAAEVWVAKGGSLLGQLVLRDTPRADARAALGAMRTLGIDRLVLLTGDRKTVAREVAEALGIDEVIAEVLPAQKLEVVRAEQAAGRTVMMVGDGVNDAPALAGADVGVAIGAELNEVALGGADVALLGPDLGRLPRLVTLADRTRRVIAQNVNLALALSALLIALAATGILDPLVGALAQSATVIAVVVNGSRILREDKVAGEAAGASAEPARA